MLEEHNSDFDDGDMPPVQADAPAAPSTDNITVDRFMPPIVPALSEMHSLC